MEFAHFPFKDAPAYFHRHELSLIEMPDNSPIPSQIKHRGAWDERLEQSGLSIERERAFAAEWEAFADAGGLQKLFLTSLLSSDSEPQFLISKQDALVAATVAQWLGSNAGMSFLQRALRKAGLQIVPVS